MKPAPILLIAFMMALPGCGKTQQNLSPADEKLVPVYSQLLLLNEEFKSRTSTLDSAAYQQKLESILSKHGFTKQELTNRLNALAQSAELFQQFQTKVREDLGQRKTK